MNNSETTSHRSPSVPGKQALIVIGMHRSGTSATTGALQHLGVQLGKKLYKGHRDINAKGYFEHSDIAETNDEALLALGSCWDDILLKEDAWWERDVLHPFAEKIRHYIRRDFSKSALWGVKDPRICRLLPWWLPILSAEGINPHFLFIVRSPTEVYRSLERRDGFSPEKSFLLWALHYLEAERNSRGHPRCFISFDRFLENPAFELQRAETELGVNFPVAVSVAKDRLSGFISQDLRHHKAVSDQIATTPFIELARELYTRLQGAAANSGAESGLHTDDLWQHLTTIMNGISPMVLEHLRAVCQHRGQVELTVHRVIRSWSWYTGKPIRLMERLLGRDV